MRREELTGLLRPLVERMCVSHCWGKGKNGPRHIAEPFTEVKLSEHVMGGTAYGLCPIAPGESTTRVACLDFDSHKGETPWPEMQRAAERVQLALEMDGYTPQLFRSSGGRGIHLYLTWDAPQDAYSVREMLAGALNACGLSNGTAGVAAGCVEIFPKQDEVPHDGVGSMFVLPLTGASEPLGSFDGFRSSGEVPVARRPERAAERVVDLSDPDIARLRSALSAIPNEGLKELSYDDWRNIIFGIHHASGGSDEGLALAHEFSARSAKYERAFLDERVWPYVRGERGGAVVTERSILARAGEHGWQDPAVADDFEVLPGVVDAGTHVSTTVDTTTPRFTWQQAAEFSAGAAPRWLIHEVIPDADLIVVYGESQSGKSFLATDMGCAVARGVPWRGRHTEQCRVGYIVAEGAQGFKKRLHAYRDHHGVNLADLDLMLLADAPNFMERDDIVALGKSIIATGPIGLIVVDTLAKVTPGANENAGEDMGRVIGHCLTLRRVTGAAVLLIHHSGKDASRGARGWSGLRAAADAEIEVSRADHDRVATVTKLKDAEDGAEFGFKLVTVNLGTDERGEAITSCVVEHGDVAPAGQRKAPLKGEHQKRVLELVRTLVQLDGALPTSTEVIDAYIEATPFDTKAGKQDRRRDLGLRALNGLISAGRVAMEGVHVREVVSE